MKIEKQFINIIFDAGKGESPVASREAVSGEAFGALPRPKRAGYRFTGWLWEGKVVDENSILTSEDDILLVAQWEKAKRTKKVSMLRRQKTALVVLSVLCVVLIAALLIVNEIIKFDTITFENVRYVNGERVVDTYYIQHVDGAYKVFDKDGKAVPTNMDGYYIVAGGNQYKVDPATGEFSLYAAVDIEGNESVGVNGLILMFEQIQQKDVYSIEVKGGSHAPYRFYRDAAGNVQVQGAEKTLVTYNKELYASLCVSTGYTIASKKLNATAPDSVVPKLADGSIDYSAFGLSDADNPTIYTITKAKFSESGECLPDESVKYSVKVGDKTLPGGGYYVQLIGRDTVYILPYTLADTVLQPIEALVQPQVMYPMSMSTFLCVENFLLGNYDMNGFENFENEKIKPIVAFSYLDLSARNTTISGTKPYIVQTELMEGYDINDANASEMLTLLSEMEYVACRKLGITQEALREYNLDGKVFYIEFNSPVVNASNVITGYIPNKILISPKTAQGTYYMASITDGEHAGYDMIVEVDQYYLSFLEWNLSDWYYPNFFTPSISNVPEMKFHIGGKDFTFRLDNALSYMFYEAADGTMKQVDLETGSVVQDANGGWVYVKGGTRYAVQSFDLSKGNYYFRIVNLQDGKNTVTYEPFHEYRFTVDRNGCQTLYAIRNDSKGNRQEYEYVLTYLEGGVLKRARQYSLIYRDENGKEFTVMGKYATGSGSNEYVDDNYQHSYWKEILTKDENGAPIYKWQRITFGSLANGVMLRDETGATDKLYEIDIATKNVKVYCDQFLGGSAHINLLDYTLVYEYKTDKGTMKTEQVTGIENFRQFYTNLVSYTIEGDIDESVFAENMGMSTDAYIKTHKEDASFSFRVQDMAKNTNLYTILTSNDDLASEIQYWEKNNEQDIVVRFYRYSDRKVMMTVELVKEYDANGNPVPNVSNTVGKFYVLTTVLDMIEEDLTLLLDPSLKTPVPERS